MSMKTVMIIDGICIVLFLFMWIYMFALSDRMQDQLMPVFTIINPFQTGAWIIGVGFLVTCLWGKGKSALIWGIVLLVCYLITAAVSVIGLMVMTSALDLLWYLHPVLIVIACIIAIRRRKRVQNNYE